MPDIRQEPAGLPMVCPTANQRSKLFSVNVPSAMWGPQLGTVYHTTFSRILTLPASKSNSKLFIHICVLTLLCIELCNACRTIVYASTKHNDERKHENVDAIKYLEPAE